MPLFLIPLAFSLFSAGAGIFSQIQENSKLEEAGQKAVADQIAKNATDRIDQYAQYISTIDTLNDEQAALDQQALADAVKTQHTITLALFGTAALLLLLTIVALIPLKTTVKPK